MNIDSFRMFCRVVEEGSISQAARLGFVSQPAVTRQIRQLENSFETTLFDRVEGKLKITKAGEFLYPYAKEILSLNKDAYDGIQEQLGKQDKTLRVGASITIGDYLLPALIGRFRRIYPDINFSLSIGNTPLMLKRLEDDEIDIALVEGLSEDAKYPKQKFADDELVLVTSYNHPWGEREYINISELSNEKMIWREKESGTRHIVENALKEHVSLDKIENAMELGSMQAIKSAVEANLGICILPKLTVQKELKYNYLREIPIKDFNLMRDFWIVQKERRFKKEAETSFEKFLME